MTTDIIEAEVGLLPFILLSAAGSAFPTVGATMPNLWAAFLAAWCHRVAARTMRGPIHWFSQRHHGVPAGVRGRTP